MSTTVFRRLGSNCGASPRACFGEIRFRGCSPIVFGQARKLRSGHRTKQRDRLVPARDGARRREIALDPRQARALEDRADIVQHDSRNEAGPQRADQHRDDSAARRADEDRVLDAESGGDSQDVLRLDDRPVVPPVRVGVGKPAAAVVDRDHRARLARVTGEELRRARGSRASSATGPEGRGEASASDDAASKMRHGERQTVLRADADDAAAMSSRSASMAERVGDRRSAPGASALRSATDEVLRKRQRVPDPRAIELQVLHHLLHVVARLVEGDAFDPVDRIDCAAARIAVAS